MKLANSFNNYLISQRLPAPMRNFIRINLSVVIGLLGAGIATFMYNTFIFWLAIGGLISFWNFFFLAIFIQKLFILNMLHTSSAGISILGQVFLSNLRLFISGFFLYAIIVYWNGNIIALIIGLSLSISMIPFLLFNVNKN